MGSASASSAQLRTGQLQLIKTEKPRWRDTFISLRVRNYRIFVIAQVVGNTGLWMQRVAQDWLVLSLTGSVSAVGLTVALQFTPVLLLGLFGGVLADRYSKRMLLMITQSVAGSMAAILAILALTGHIQAWHVYVIAVMLGLVTVVDNPTRQAFVNEMVGRDYLRNAISINSSIFQLGGLIGPALSGLLINAVGEGYAFALNALGYVFVICMLSNMRRSELDPAPKIPRAKGQLSEGLRYIKAKPEIVWTIVLLGVVGIFGLSMPVVLAAFADRVFHTGAGGYGLFNSLVAVGALIGALASTRRRSIRLRTLVVATIALGAFQMLAAGSSTVVMFGVLLAANGLATILFMTGANSLVQLTTNARLRGRVMAVYVLVMIGSQAFGGLIIGWISEHIGPRAGMLTCGLVPFVAAVVIGIALARIGKLRLKVSFRRHSGRQFVSIVQRGAGV